MTEVLKFDPREQERCFSRCSEVVSAGGVIVYPTETFYGLGVDPRNPSALARLFKIKERPSDQPILLLIHDISEVRNWAAEVNAQAEKLMKAFWPGPLTLVFKAKQDVPQELTGNTGTIGLRMPGNELTRNLLKSFGRPLTGTSANISGLPSADSTAKVLAMLEGRVDIVLDAGKTTGGQASTIVDVTGDVLKVIRKGAIPVEKIFKI